MRASNVQIARAATLAMALSLALAACGGAGRGRTQPLPTSAPGIEDRIDRLFARWDRTDSPGCAVGVMREGRLVFARGYGMASLEHGVPITPATVFNSASISKQFTAAAVVLLAQRGELSLDDDVRRYIPELPDFGAPITLRHLVHHTSGLRFFWPGGAFDRDDVLEMTARLERLDFLPGQQYRYYFGYELLAVVVGRVSGRTLRDFTRAEIFEPLGMHSSFFLDDLEEVVQDVAHSYLPGADGGFRRTRMVWFPIPGATMLHTTVEDLARWDRNFYEPRVGGSALLEQLHERGRLNDGTQLDYAFGLEVRESDGRRVVQHGGWALGFRHHFVRFPEEGLSVALLCNAGGTVEAWRLAHEVAALHLPARAPAAADPARVVAPVALAPERLADKAGLYWDPQWRGVRRITFADGKLYVTDPDGEPARPYDLEALSERMFRVVEVPDVAYRYERDGAAGPWRVTRYVGAQATHTLEAQSFFPTPAELEQYAGLYLGEEVDLVYRVALENEGLVLKRLGAGRGPLQPLAPDLFKGPDWYLHFLRNAAGRVMGISFNSVSNRDFRFRRVEHRGEHAPAAAQTGPPSALALRGVTVVDVREGRLHPDMTVLVEGDRIAEVGKRGTITAPSGARVVDAGGKWLIPGLWDMHVHACNEGRARSLFPLFLANGVTGIRCMDGSIAALERLREDIRSGRVLPLHVLASGPIMDGPPARRPGPRLVETARDALDAVREKAADPADFIKAYENLSPEAYAALASEAQRLEIVFVGHVPHAISAAEASGAGQKSIEHLTGWLPLAAARAADRSSPELDLPPSIESLRFWLRLWDDYDSARAERLFATLAANRTWVVPTLVLERNMWGEERDASGDPRTKYVFDWGDEFDWSERSPEDLALAERLLERQRDAVGAMHGAGVRLLAGTDAPFPPWVFPGFGLHEELELLVRSGLTPADALRTATSNAADFLGWPIGDIRPGNFADLVLLDGNPLEDIGATGRIEAVVLRGRLFDRGALDALLADLEEAAQTTEFEREVMYHRYLDFASYVKGGSVEPHWMADGNRFWYAERGPDGTVIWKVDPVANTKRPLFDVDRLRRALATMLGHEPPHLGVPFDRFTFTNGEKAVRFGIDGSEFILDLDTYDVRRAPPPSEDELLRSERGGVFSPDGRWVATVRDYNLWLRSTKDGSEIQLTSDGATDHEWQLGAAAWSPDGFTLAAMKVDSRQAPRVPLVDWLGPNEEVEWARFPRKPGQPIALAELFLIDVRSGKRVRVDSGGEQELSIGLVRWVPDGSHLLFFISRPYRRGAMLMAADAATGSTRVLLDERHPVRFRTVGPYPGETPFTFLDDGKRFVWLSGRTGWRHLYLYDLAGQLIRPITQGEFPVEQVLRADEEAGWVYFTARGDAERPYDNHLYRVSLKGEGLTRLTEAPGQRDIRFAPSGLFFLDAHSSVDRPPAVELRRANGELLRVLSAADVDALEELNWSPPEEFVVKTADGTTDLHGVLYKPFDFHPDKKYPVILHTLPAGRTFTGREVVWAQAIAQLGFITFKVDVREPQLSWRGGEFDRVTRGTIGRYEVPDYVAALKGLAAERPYMDLSRVGVFGGSYGGYHAIRAMLQAPDVFHVGVAVNAITDAYGHPNFYVLGSPEDNRQAFEEASNLSLAGNLEGRLLLVHGTHDTSVPFSHAMKMVDALIREGKPYDLIVVPGWGHWDPDTEEWERYRLEAYRRYFVEHLQPD